MRLAPAPLFYADKPLDATEKSGKSSRTTHGAVTTIDACPYIRALAGEATSGVSKKEDAIVHSPGLAGSTDTATFPGQ